jgi:RHS repeat-associated protein
MRFYYDLEWQLTGTSDPEGHATSWTYDLAGNRKTQTDARGNTYTWNYDNRNRVVSEVNALNQTTTFSYDAAGNRLSRLNAAGELTFWNYDAMNRVTTNGAGALAYAYEYDLAGRRVTMKTILSNVVTETTSYTYDLRNLLLTKLDPSGFTLSYGYNEVGARTSLVVAATGGGPAVLSQSYTYDTRNRVSTITGNGRTTTYSYDAASRRTGSVWPNNTTTTNVFDAANQLLSMVHGRAGSPSQPIASFAYEYDLAGNRTKMTTLEGDNVYGYNKDNWLVSAAYPDGHAQGFFYDAVGNRTNLVETMSGAGTLTTASTYDAGNRIQTAVSATETNAYTFDAAGRLVGQTVNGHSRSHAYSFRSQMTSLTDTNSAASTYSFDADQNRVAEVGSAGPAVRYVYDGPNVVLDLESGIVKAAYVHSLGIDQPIERIQFIAGVADGRHVYHTDALGSVWAMTDDLQVVAKSYAYEAFGKIRSEYGSGLLFPNRYTYTARESLGDTLGHHYYRARVMDPRLGRFTSEDPFEFREAENLFAYAENNPNVYSDPLGMFCADSNGYDRCKSTAKYEHEKRLAKLKYEKSIWLQDCQAVANKAYFSCIKSGSKPLLCKAGSKAIYKGCAGWVTGANWTKMLVLLQATYASDLVSCCTKHCLNL